MSVFRIVRKFHQILSNQQRKKVVELALLMVVGGFLETISVSLIMPFMQAVMEPEKTMSKPVVKTFCDAFGIDSSRTFLVVLAIILALIYIFKNLFLLFEYNVQYRFVYGNMFAMQSDILKNYIHRPYEYFLSANSGEIIRIISNDTTVVFNMLSSILVMFTEIVVSAALVIVTFVLAPAITIFIGAVLLVLVFVINFALKPVLHKAGVNRQTSGASMNQWLIQSVEGIKELKVQRREDYFQNNFDKSGTIYVNSVRQNAILGVIPRFMIEAISMSAFFVVVAVMIGNGVNLAKVVPMLSAVAMAAIRLLPSVNRISNALAQISYGEPALDKMIENLNTINNRDSTEINKSITQISDNAFPVLKNQISVEKITYHYPKTSTNVLNEASLSINSGDSIGIVGASGAGKTTLIDIILGLLKPSEGSVKIDGVDIKSNINAWLSQVGYIPQMIFLLDGSIRENVAFGENPDEVNDADVWKALEEASMGEFVHSLLGGLDTQLGERGVRISGGQRQRIGIARALYYNPSVLIFDEATSALDKDTESAIMDSINHLHGSKTMLIIAHRLTTIEGCDHVYRVENGKILQER